MKHKNIRITIEDFLLANRKAAREEEIAAYGKQIIFRRQIHKSKKSYNRQKFKRYGLD